MQKAIYPGTFDPITNGHLDIIERARAITGKVIVAVFKDPQKEALFSYEERRAIVEETVKKFKNVEVQGFGGLVVDFAKKNKVKVIIRGLRMISDFEYEFQMALTNRKISSFTETVFLMPHPNYSFISSRLVKEAFSLGANLEEFLPIASIRALNKKLHASRNRKNK